MERARNTVRQWTGDPERWGTAVSWSASVGATEVTTSAPKQALRAQLPDLISVAWDLVVRWSITGLTAGDRGTLTLPLSIGTGQATSSLAWVLATIDGGAALAASTPRVENLGWSPTNAPLTMPYAGIATILAPAVIASFTPAVPANYRLHVTAWGVGGNMTRSCTLLLREGAAQLGGVGNWIGGFAAYLPTAVDWWVAPGQTPFLALDGGGPGTAGERMDSSLTGYLHLANNSGVAVSGDPIVACAINGTPAISILTSDPPHTVNISLNAHCAPRSWVP